MFTSVDLEDGSELVMDLKPPHNSPYSEGTINVGDVVDSEELEDTVLIIKHQKFKFLYSSFIYGTTTSEISIKI